MKKYLFGGAACLMILALGLVSVHCGGGGATSCTSSADCDTAKGEYCNLDTKTCVIDSACTINADCNSNEFCNLVSRKCEARVNACDGKCCGDDGQGGQCPNICAGSLSCDTGSCECKVCTPECGIRECGPDPVCGEICGSCSGTQICEDGTCVDCTPNCAGLECGPDPVCGEECGPCGDGFHCNTGVCEAGAAAPGDPCPNGDSDCPPEFPICLSGGTLTYCSKQCATEADCQGAPNCCVDFGSGAFCWDETQCPGDAAPGAPCPFGLVNEAADKCSEGSVCLGVDADGDGGQCGGGTADECTELYETWNRDCVSGECGASFCSATCEANGTCVGDFVPQEVTGLGCQCIPQPDSECTDASANVGCTDANAETCMPVGGSALLCAEAGDVPELGDCTAQDAVCEPGMVCVPLGTVSRCWKLCDADAFQAGDAEFGCPAGEYSCAGWVDVTRWGFCVPADPCTMESGGAECAAIDDGLTCSVQNMGEEPEDDCTDIHCIFHSGKTEGEACEYLNSCVNGLICIGDPGVCTPTCGPGAVDACDTAGGETCVGIDGCVDTPSVWGVCGTE